MSKKLCTQKKTFVILVIFCMLITGLSAQVYFDSEGGIALDVLPQNNFTEIDMNISAFYAAQIQFSNDVLFESAFSFNTLDITNNVFMQDIPTEFSIDKLSLSYYIAGRDFDARVSLFAGDHDTIGSDEFAVKYFGTQSFGSPILEKQVATDEASIIPIDGYGLAISSIYSKTFGTAFYGYYNQRFSQKQLNFDIRFVGVTDAFIGDFAFGTSLPFDSKDSAGNPIILIIRRADLHLGMNMLIGNNPHANLYLQAGIARIQLKPDPGNEVFSLSDLHVFLEPRFAVGNVKFNFAAFMLPLDTIDKVEYIDKPHGASFYLEVLSNTGRIKRSNGVLVSASVDDFFDQNFDISKLSINAVPFVEYTIGEGTFKIALPIKPLEYQDFANMLSLNVSYVVEY